MRRPKHLRGRLLAELASQARRGPGGPDRRRSPYGRSHGSGSRLGGVPGYAAGCPAGPRSHRRGRCMRSRARGRARGLRSGRRARQGVRPRRSLRGTTGDARGDGVLDVNAWRNTIQAARHHGLCDREGLHGSSVRSVRQPDAVRVRRGQHTPARGRSRRAWARLAPASGNAPARATGTPDRDTRRARCETGRRSRRA